MKKLLLCIAILLVGCTEPSSECLMEIEYVIHFCDGTASTYVYQFKGNQKAKACIGFSTFGKIEHLSLSTRGAAYNLGSICQTTGQIEIIEIKPCKTDYSYE